MGGTGANRIAASSSWTTVERFRSSPPDTSGDWWIGCSFSANVSPSASGHVRLVATDDLGGQWATEEKALNSSTTGDLTKWVKVLDGAESSRPYFIEIQMRAEGVGFTRLTEVEPAWISTPTAEIQQPSIQANVANASFSRGASTRTLPNPIQGTGGTLIAIAVVSGPGYDNAGDQWIEPANATTVIDYEVQPASVYQFVQRVRVWSFTDDGAANYTFGYEKLAGEQHQQVGLVGLDRLVPKVNGYGPVVNTDANTGYPSATVVDDYLVFALSTTQQQHQMTTHPTGYAVHLDGTGLGGATDWRRFTIASRGASNTTETPAGAVWSAGAGEAHAHFVLTVPPGS